MATITVGDMCKFTYTITVNNTADFGTLVFTLTGAENLSPSKYKSKKGFWAGIKIDGKNFVGHTSKLAATAKYSNQGASGVLGSLNGNERPVVYFSDKQDYKEARKKYNEEQQRYFSDNIEVLIDKINKKKTAGKNTKNIKVTGNQRDITIVFQVYGYKQTVTHKVGKASSTASNTAEEGVEYTSITSVNNGIPYLVKTDAYKEYGWIERVVDFNDIDDPATLKRVGQIYLDSLQFDEMSIEVTALDLHYIDNTVQKLALLDTVRCISKPHGLNKVFPITKVTIPLDHPDQVKYTLGTNQAGGGGISASSSMDAKKFTKALQSYPTKAYTLDTAKGQMSQMLNQRTTGYVTIVDRTDPNDNQTRSEAIIISSGKDWTKSQSLWKWDMNGLGFSDKKLSDLSQEEQTAYNAAMRALGSKAIDKVSDEDRWYRLGITNDGKIVADVIKTGLLSDAKGLNEWDLTNGTFKLTGMTTVIDNSNPSSPTSTTLKTITNTSKEAKTMAGTAIDKANTANNKQYGYTNYLKGTKSPVLKADSSTNQTNSYRNGWWLTSSNTYAPSIGTDITLVSGIKAYVNLPSKSSIKQANVPLEPGVSYTVSCKAKYKTTGPKRNETKLTIEAYQTASPSIKMTPKTATLTASFETYQATFKVPKSNSDTINYTVAFSNTTGYAVMVYGFKLEKGNMATDWADQNNISADDVYNNMVEYVDTYGKLKSASTLATLTQANIIKRLTGMDAGKQANGMWLAGGRLYISATSIRSGKIISDNSKSYWDLTTGELLSINSTFTGKIENIENNAGLLYYAANKKNTKFKTANFDRIVNVQKGLCAFRAKYTVKNKKTTIKAGSIGVETRKNIYGGNLALEITANQSLAITAPAIEIRKKPSDSEEYAETKTVHVLSSDKKKVVTLKFVNGFYVGDGSSVKGTLLGR